MDRVASLKNPWKEDSKDSALFTRERTDFVDSVVPDLTPPSARSGCDNRGATWAPLGEDIDALIAAERQ
jgi:hypothetical protein